MARKKLVASPKFSFFLCLIFGEVLPYTLTSDNIEEHTYSHPSVGLSDYSSYSSAVILEYSIPEKALWSQWYLNGIRKPDSCKQREIVVYLQHGSYPVISPLNETFPPHFNTQRTQLKQILVPTGNQGFIFTLEKPLPGSWFAAAFVGALKDDAIHVQTGMSASCQYRLLATQVTSNLQYVDDLLTNVQLPLTATSSGDVYRFFINSDTWKYQIKLSNCSQENSTDTACPLQAVVRGSALPRYGVDDSLDCDITKECSMTKISPETDVWHYLEIKTTHNSSLSMNIDILTTECTYHPKWINTTTPPTPTAPANVSNSTTALPMDQNTSTLQAEASSGADSSPATANNSADPSIRIHASGDNNNGGDIFAYKEEETNVKLLGDHNYVKDLNVQADDRCLDLPELGRYSVVRRPFFTDFRLQRGLYLWPSELWISDEYTAIMYYQMRRLVDSGGTHRAHFVLDVNRFRNLTLQEATVDICIRKGSIPVDNYGPACESDFHLQLNTTDSSEQLMYFPYPEPGLWYISMRSTCYNRSEPNSTLPAVCRDAVPVTFNLVILPCVDNSCGPYGSCVEYYSGIYHYSSCNCKANYRGYGCTDASVALSDLLQWIELFFLTLSNLAFIPAIIIALYGHYYAEALVYFYNMFFSAFYHACDGNRRYILCIAPYNVLQHCDFFASITSFWVTIIAMAKVSYRMKAFLYMLSGLGLSIGVTWDRRNLWTFMVPFAVAVIIMVICWGIRMYRTKKLYPPWKRWVFFLLPGVAFALTGLIIFAFFETGSNYKYTHSAWHILMATSICFLLPPRPKKKGYLLPKFNNTTETDNGGHS